MHLLFVVELEVDVGWRFHFVEELLAALSRHAHFAGLLPLCLKLAVLDRTIRTTFLDWSMLERLLGGAPVKGSAGGMQACRAARPLGSDWMVIWLTLAPLMSWLCDSSWLGSAVVYSWLHLHLLGLGRQRMPDVHDFVMLGNLRPHQLLTYWTP